MKKLIFLLVIVAVALISHQFFFSSLTESYSDINFFRMSLGNDPDNLDPARGVDVSEASVQSKIFDGLVRYDEQMNLVNALAESWAVCEDGVEYRFELREGISFHCGQELTAEDVVFSFNRILSPEVNSPRSWVLDRVDGATEMLEGESETVSGIEAVDEHTVLIRLSEPFAPFISLLTMPACFVLPSSHSKSIASRDFFNNPSGTGPYKMSSRVRDSYIRLTANQNYFAQTPHVEGILVRIIPEPMSAEMEFESGKLDLLQLQPASYQRFVENPRYKDKITNVAAMNIFYVGLNNQSEVFSNKKVRQAVNMLVNRQSIVDSVFDGRAVIAKGSIPPGLPGYSEETEGYEYNPTKALELLKEAGYDEDNPLEFDLYQRSSQAAFEITRLVQGELTRHGVVVNLKPMEWSAMLDAVTKGEADAFYISWFGDYPDGENFLYPLYHSSNWGSGGNRAMFKNETIDELLDTAVAIQDPDERNEKYDKINRMIIEQAPWIYLWHQSETYIIGDRVSEITFHPLFFCDKGLSVKLHSETAEQ